MSRDILFLHYSKYNLFRVCVIIAYQNAVYNKYPGFIGLHLDYCEMSTVFDIRDNYQP